MKRQAPDPRIAELESDLDAARHTCWTRSLSAHSGANTDEPRLPKQSTAPIFENYTKRLSMRLQRGPWLPNGWRATTNNWGP